MNIGLVDIDGHHFPNLALMKLSAWHMLEARHRSCFERSCDEFMEQ